MGSLGQGLARIALAVGGLMLLGVAWLYAQLPRPDSSRVEVTPELVGVYDGVSFAWLLRTRRGAALIDAGLDQEGRAILEELRRQGLGPEDVHTLLITHGHPDHWGAARLFGKATVYVGPGEAALLRGERRSERPASALLDRLEPAPLPPPALEELAGGAVLEVDGERIRVFHLPGHTPGSLAFLWGHVLFTGDALTGQGARVSTGPSFFSEDPERGRESLRPLVKVPFTLIADGHRGVVADARQKLERLLR